MLITIFIIVRERRRVKFKKIDMPQCLEKNFKVILNLAVYAILYMLGGK